MKRRKKARGERSKKTDEKDEPKEEGKGDEKPKNKGKRAKKTDEKDEPKDEEEKEDEKPKTKGKMAKKTDKKDEPKEEKKAENYEDEEKEGQEPQTDKKAEKDADMNDGKKKRKVETEKGPPKSFARRNQPSTEPGKARWEAIKMVFGQEIKPHVSYHSKVQVLFGKTPQIHKKVHRTWNYYPSIFLTMSPASIITITIISLYSLNPKGLHFVKIPEVTYHKWNDFTI